MTHLVRNAALGAAIAALGASAGAQSAPGQFQAIGIPVDKPFVSKAADTRPVMVVAILSGEPVAVVQQRLGRKLSPAERQSIIAARKAEQQAVQPSIQGIGGKVLAQMQSALNGVKVQISKNRIPALRKIPGVIDVQMVGTYERLNVNEVQLMGAPLVWQALGNYQGQGIKIAILDTGIDYTHANFGGPGTVAAYNAAFATDTLPADPSMFGPGAPKVKGGTDLVGDAYTGAQTGAGSVPIPDPNPLDCPFTSGNVGHGSHVAGTATGFGVKSDGTTYTGPYNAAAYTPGAFSIGPGVAPKADLYSVRVFGCSGVTNVVAEAIDWGVANGMDVISMSLGSNYGNISNGDPDSMAEGTAVANAAAAGILVIAASGNAGQTPYITSAPAAFEGAISVAATDALPGVPTASLALSSGPTLSVQNSNSGVFANGTNYPIVVLRNPDGSVSLGCNPDEYDPSKTGVSLAGKMVVSVRGTCARTFRAGAAQHFGAAAAAMINSSGGFPPYEGPIPGGASNPNSGNIYEPVTIPFFGVAQADGATISGPTGGPAPSSATATNAGIVPNAGFERIASFSSSGPRIGDSVLRPGITAPGVSVVSTASGTGNGFEILSGTSMATPGVAGVAALVKQAHPTWSQPDLRAAIVQTASPSMMQDLLQRNEGAGLVQAQAATTTQAVVRLPDESVSFGYADLLTDYSATRTVTVHNTGPKAVQFNISVTKTSGPAGANLTAPPSVIVNGSSDATFDVRLDVPASSVGGGTGFQDIGGYIQLTPSNSRLNGNVKLTVPYYLVAHSRSNVTASLSGSTLNLANPNGALAGTPSFYTWGLSQPTPQGVNQADVRAVGVALSGSNVVFAVNTHNRTSTTLAFQELEVCIDTSGGAGFTPNKVLIGINGSALSSTLPASSYATAIFPANADCSIPSGASGTVLSGVVQSTDSSTVFLPVTISSLGLTSANPRFKYTLSYAGTDGSNAQMPGIGSFNAITPALTFTSAPTLAPNTAGSATVTVSGEIANSPALGVMVVAPDNVSGASQATLLPLQAAK